MREMNFYNEVKRFVIDSSFGACGNGFGIDEDRTSRKLIKSTKGN